MATKCINKLGNPEQYQRLKDHFKFSDGVLDAKIGVWQEQHNTDEFPTIEQMELYEKNRPKNVTSTYSEHESRNEKTIHTDLWLETMYNMYGDRELPISSLLDLLKRTRYWTIVEHFLEDKALRGVSVKLYKPTFPANTRQPRAHYNSESRIIDIDVSAKYTNGDSASVIMHEIMHALTINRFNRLKGTDSAKYQEFVDILHRYQEHFKGTLKQPYTYHLYGRKMTEDEAVKEFFADIWSNPNTIKTAQRIDSDKQLTLWDRIKSYFYNLIFEDTKTKNLFIESSVELWQLLEEPLTNEDFDRWSDSNSYAEQEISKELYTKVGVEDYIADLVADGIKREDIKVVHTPVNEVKNEDEYWTVSYTTQQDTEATSEVPPTLFIEEPTTGYRNRTIKNAGADATIAFAVDFNSAGERLTKSSVLQQGKKYIPVDTNNPEITDELVESIVNQLNEVNAKSLNIAGNGIYTLKGKYTQEQVDNYVYELLLRVVNSPDLKTPIATIRSGGQTGYDEAGIKAAQKLGIVNGVLAPKGWKFRDINGRDISDEQAFKARFTTQQTTTQQQTNITNMEEKINESVETPQEEPQTVTPLEEVSDDARHQMYRTWNAKTIAARALRIAKMFSDEVTDIEMKLPMGERQLSSFDTRTYIITKGVGAQKIFERIKKKIADTYANPEWARQTLSEVYGDIEEHPEEFQKKVDYMVQQGNYMLKFFEPLCLEANNEIKQNESTSIFSKDGDVISVAEEEIEEFEEAISKHDEGWANKVHERSAEETLDREIRLLLANIYELDDEGYYTRLDDLEEPVPYGFGYVHSTLLNIVSKVTSDVAMMPTLKKNVAKFPWIQQVINLIGGQDTSNVTIYNGLSEAERKAKALSLQALFWKGMHKIHVNIATQTLETENEGGEAKITLKIVNSPEGEEAALRGYENVCYTSKTLYDNGNPYKHVYNPDGTFNSKVYNDMWTLWNNSAIKQEMFKWDGSHVPTQEDLETLTTVLRAFGIDTPLANIYDLINPSDDSVVRQEQAEKIVALNSALSTGFYNAQRGNNNPLKRVSSKETPENIFDAFNVQYRTIARVFGDSIMGYEESSARFKLDNEDKKLYSHIFPNHISTIFNKLINVDRVSEDEYKERLQKTYLSNWWFTSADGKHIRNGWLRDCLNNPKLRRGIRLKSLKASMGRGYASEINAQAEITRLNEFFHGNHAIGKINFREYSVPAFSDTSENYFCRGRYYNIANAEQHNELLNNLADVLKQEMERRNVVIRRYQLIKEDLEAGRPPRIKPIAGWDISFKIEDGKLVPALDKPNGTQFFFFPSINAREFSKEYNSLPVESREEFIRSQVEKALNEEFQFYLKQFNEYGINQIPRSDYTIDIAGRTALVSNLKAQIVGTSSRLSKIENSLSKEAMTENIFRSLLAQWKEEAIKVYPQLNTTAVDAIMANYKFSKDQVLIDKLQDFFENSFYATSQIIQLTMRDIAFLGTPDKFQKRFKQFYSPVATCYTCHYMVNENGDLELLDPNAPDSLVKTTEVSITLAEANLKSALSIDNIRAAINAQLQRNRITPDQAREIEKSLGELGSGIDIADAQCYRTLPSWKKCLNMIGKGSNLKVQQAIERLENGEWSYEDYNIVWQVFKPFVSSYYEVPSHLPEAEQFPQYTNISVPTQHKNSEFLLLAIYSKLSGVLQDSYKLKGLNKFMVDHGIDKAQFESAVKVGNQGSIDLKDCTTEEEVIATLEAATGLHGNMQADKEGNPDVLHRMPFSDWGISTAMPEHLLEHEKSSMGTQIMKIIMEDMPEEGCMINGVRKTRAQWLELYQAIFTQNLKEAFAEVDETLTTTKKLAEYLKKQIYSQNKYSQDLIDHLEIGPDGNFKNPIIDPMLRSQFDSLCASLIRKEVTKRPFRMGALPQVASWGFEDKIQLRFQDNSGNLIYTEEEFEEKLKDEHVVTITVGDKVLSFHTWKQYQDYAKTNATRIKYMEVLLPPFDNNFSRNIRDAFIDKKTGKFDHKLFNEKLSPKMREALSYRVPSEAKHSMIPIYVKGFLPAQNSSCIVVPPEWIAFSDSDNDGDKLYTLFHESMVIWDAAAIKQDYAKQHGFTYMSKKQREKARLTKNNFKDLNYTKSEEIDMYIDMIVSNQPLDEEGKAFKEFLDNAHTEGKYIKSIVPIEFITKKLDRIEGETDSQYQQRCDLASIASNSAAARNNKLLEMMNAILQTEDNTQFILTPGGFPVIKRVTDKIKKLLGVTSDTASICNPAMRTIHQIRNMAGANLIPVYANYRALRPLMQLADLKLHPRCQVVINGNYSLPKDSRNNPTWSLSAYRNAVGEYITDNISNFLGCAVDNAKDPRLSFSGQSLLTAPISMMMINMGYTIEETALFMMQPAVRDLVREYYLNNEEVQLKDLITKKMQTIVDNYHAEGKAYPECSIPNFLELPNGLMEDQIKKDAAGVVPTEDDDAVQLQVLNVLQKLLVASDALNNINTVTRANTQNGAASSESSRNKQRLLTISRMQTEVKREDFPIIGAEALVPTIDKFNQDEDIKNSKIPMNAAFRFYGIDQIPEMFKHISLTFNALVDTVHRAAMNLTDKPTLPISTIDGLTNAVASYTLSSIDAFNRTNSYTGYRATVMKLFPSILASIKRDNLIPDNMLINDLVANVTGNVYSKSLPFITLPKSTKRNQGAITNYRRAWESLYENGDTEIKVKWNNQIIPLTYRDVANFLLSYCFFTNGMNAGGNSFISCFPKGRIPEIEGYIDALKSLERGTLTDTQTILDQYVANHPEDSTFTTRISVADFNKAIKTEKGIPTRIIVDTINSQDNKTLETFTVKDTASKARKAHPYIFVTDGKGVRYLYKGYSYDDRVVYYRCEVLGNTSSKYLEEYQKGKSIAYERADGIKSIIPSNNPNTILTSEVSTGIEAKRSTGQGVTLDDVRTIVSNLLSPDATKASVKVQDFNEQTNDLTGVEFCVII